MSVAREAFCAALWTGPLCRGDVIVVLCGEDAEARVATGVQLFASGGASRILLSGGRDDPPRRLGAARLQGRVFEAGIAPDRVLTEEGSQHTRDQAVNVLRLALEGRWRRLLLVASAYHLPRAFLTFVRAIHQAPAAQEIQIVPVPAARTSWWDAPPAIGETRLALLWSEFGKIERYHADVATYEEGLAYLQRWESA